MKQELIIDGMHCGGCVAKVKRTIEAIPGVTNASIYLPNSGIIDCAARIDVSEYERVLSAVGTYSVREGRVSVLASLQTFMPLIAMFGIVLAWSIVLMFPLSHHPLHDWMRHFMGGFFLLFGGLKVVNLNNFAAMYRGYDPLAARAPVWGYVYPFVEVALGVLYTLDAYAFQTNVVTAALMTFGAIGIVRKLQRGGVQTCACLGGFFSVPLTKVTVAENMLMAVMAVFMLFYH